TPVAITPTVFDPHAPLPVGGFRFLNGWGNLSFTLNEGAAFAPGDIEITVGWRGLTATRTVTVERAPVFRDLAGALVGANLVWGPDQNIRVTGGITVPAGSTLTIHPGTLVQVNTTGALSNGTLFTVQGAIQALGTHDRPIFFFSERGPLAMALTQQGSASNADAWRGFQFRGAGSSTFRQVFLTGAGNGTVVSHPRPPIMGLFDTHSLTVDRSVFADNNGMVFSGQGTGTYIIRKSHITRAGIGGEYFGNGHTLRVTDSWFTAVASPRGQQPGRRPAAHRREPVQPAHPQLHHPGRRGRWHRPQRVELPAGALHPVAHPRQGHQHDRWPRRCAQYADLSGSYGHPRAGRGRSRHHRQRQPDHHRGVGGGQHHLAAQPAHLCRPGQPHLRRQPGRPGLRRGQRVHRSAVRQRGRQRLQPPAGLAGADGRARQRPHRLAGLPGGRGLRPRRGLRRPERLHPRHLRRAALRVHRHPGLQPLRHRPGLRRRQPLHRRRLRARRLVRAPADAQWHGLLR
ncbi:MAG: hypothetical protein R3F43_28670, partial [bacterium]